MLIAKGETFDPIAAFLPFDTEEGVILRANDTYYGLAGYYYTRDVGRVIRLAEKPEYGILGANDGMPSTAQAPFGGVGGSGFGHEGGHQRIEEYLNRHGARHAGTAMGERPACSEQSQSSRRSATQRNVLGMREFNLAGVLQ